MIDTKSNPIVSKDNKQSFALVYAAFVAGLCSIVYELLIATTVSYFLGDSVTYFSLTIGLYMAAMGAGSYCSKFIDDKLTSRFLSIEILLALVGGLSIPLLYLSYTVDGLFLPTYVLLTLTVGFLIGMEIPFLTRLMESFQKLKSNIANILTFDYVGALIATLAFPFFLLPTLGTYLSSIVLGMVNLTIVVVLWRYFKQNLRGDEAKLKLRLAGGFLLLLVAMIMAQPALESWDQSLYSGRVIHSEQSRYQKIVLTRKKDDIRMYLNGNIQFSSKDEYRYHESLVLYPYAYSNSPIKRVLLLGAGDGLAIKQVLKYPEIEEIVLVDLDERVVELATSNPYLSNLNQNSLQHEKVTVIHGDAFSFIRDNPTHFDMIISDLPDPNNISLARLYTKQFYQLLKKSLNDGGILVTQATSPHYATKAFWSIVNTIKEADFTSVVPYHVDVPSFGEWGFVMAGKGLSALSQRPYRILKGNFISQEIMASMQVFAKDRLFTQAEVNRLDKPILLNYYLEGWQSYGH